MSDQRFWAKVEKSDGCWNYMGALNPCGYGWITRHGKQMSASRWSWSLENGPIPNGMSVLHKCDNRRCVNPSHLYLGTQTENMRDRADRRRCATQKLSIEDVAAMKAMRVTGATIQAIADKFGVSNGHTSSVIRGVHYGRE